MAKPEFQDSPAQGDVVRTASAIAAEEGVEAGVVVMGPVEEAVEGAEAEGEFHPPPRSKGTGGGFQIDDRDVAFAVEGVGDDDVAGQEVFVDDVQGMQLARLFACLGEVGEERGLVRFGVGAGAPKRVQRRAVDMAVEEVVAEGAAEVGPEGQGREGAHAAEAPPMRVGSEIAYPPFCSLDAQGRAYGFSASPSPSPSATTAGSAPTSSSAPA